MHDISLSMTQPSRVHSLLLKQFTYNTLYIFWWCACINKFSELRFSDCLCKPISSINRDAICKPISSFYQKMEILVKYWQTLNKTEKTSRIAQYTCQHLAICQGVIMKGNICFTFPCIKFYQFIHILLNLFVWVWIAAVQCRCLSAHPVTSVWYRYWSRSVVYT